MNFQADSSRQGEVTHEIAEERLREMGFAIKGVRVGLSSVEVDVMAENRRAIAFPFTIKGSWRGTRPGLERTDTLRKAIAECYLIKKEIGVPGFVIASHIPFKGRGRAALKLMDRRVIFDVLHLFNDRERLAWLLDATEADLEQDLMECPDLFELIRERQYAKWERQR